MIYRTAPFSMILNDLCPQFKSYVILWRWISHKRYEIQTLFQWNTNRDLHTPYSTVSFRMTLSVLEWQQNIPWYEASRGLSATAELLVYIWVRKLITVFRVDTKISAIGRYMPWYYQANISWYMSSNILTFLLFTGFSNLFLMSRHVYKRICSHF